MSESLVPKEILEEFKQESTQILKELASVVDKLEEWNGPFPKLELVTFALKIDQILAKAKTIEDFLPDHVGFRAIGKIAAVCKFMGYKVGQTPNPNLVPVLAAFWADSVEYIQELVDSIDDEKECEAVMREIGDVLVKRLEWAVEKINPGKSDVTIKDLNFNDFEKKTGS